MKRFVVLCALWLPAVALAAGEFMRQSTEVSPGRLMAEQQVYKGFGCNGANISPSLTWKNAPAGSPHRYIFTVHALKVDKIDADANSSAAMIGFMLGQSRIGKATLTATYGGK